SLAHFTCSDPDPSCDDCGLEVTNGGRILLSDTLTELDKVCLTIGQGDLDTSHFTRIAHADVTVEQGASVSFDAVTELDNCELFVRPGSSLAFPVLTTMDGLDLLMGGAGSHLDLSSVTAIEGSFIITAEEGATVDLPALESHGPGRLYVRALGAGTVVDLSKFTDLHGWDAQGKFNRGVLHVWDGGEIILPNTLTEADGVSFSMGQGTMSLEQLTHLRNGYIGVGLVARSFGNLRHVYNSSLGAGPGGTLALPNLTTLEMADGGYEELKASGTDEEGHAALLDLSSVTNITGRNWSLWVEAKDGGLLDVSGLRSNYQGIISGRAEGPGSVVDLSGLTSYSGGAGSYPPRLEAYSGGHVILPETLCRLDRVSLAFRDGGTMTTAQLTHLTNSSLTVWGSPVSLPNLSNVTNTSIDVQGCTVALPSLTTIHFVGDGKSAGGSTKYDGVLDFSSLTTITGDNWTFGAGASIGGSVDLSALTDISGTGWTLTATTSRDGGSIDLSSLRSTEGGTLYVKAHGQNAVVDLSSLVSLTAGPAGNSEVTAEDEGLLVLNPSAPVKTAGVAIEIEDGATITGDTLRLGPSVTVHGNATIDANVANVAGMVSPTTSHWSGRTLTITGDYLQGELGELTVAVLGLSDFDQLKVGGDARLGGTLTLEIADYVDLWPGIDVPIVVVEGTCYGTFDAPARYEPLFTDQDGEELYVSYHGGTGGNDVVLVTRPALDPSVLNSAASADWNAATTWDHGEVVPEMWHEVVIGDHKVSAAADAAAWSLLINHDGGAALVGQGSTLRITGPVQLDAGRLDVQGALESGSVELAPGANLSVAGTLDVGSLTTAGTNTIAQGAIIAVSEALTLDSDLEMTGATLITRGADVTISRGNTLTLDNQSLEAASLQLAGTLVRNGADQDISVTDALTLTESRLDLTGATLTTTPEWTRITVGRSSGLIVGNLLVGGELNVAGTVQTSGADVTAVNVTGVGSLHSSADVSTRSLTVSEGTLTARGNLTADNVDVIHGGTLGVGGTLVAEELNVAGTAQTAGADVIVMNVADGGTFGASAAVTAQNLNVTGGTFQLADGAVLNVGAMQLSGGTVDTGTGHAVISERLKIGDDTTFRIAGATFEVSGANLVDPAEPRNLTLTGGTLAIDGGFGPPLGAIAVWRLDEGDGTTAEDSSRMGNDHLGTITGATWANDDPDRGTVLSFDGNDHV
ncbi:MAG: hypothetical protein ACYSWU_13475, partial [Planctomycetota bacterium]